jgi:membrane fusion protein, heavy metal efflux system
MKRVMRLLALAAAGALAYAAPAQADSPAGAAFAPVAHSPLVTVEGVVVADTLVLRVRRSADRQPVAGAELSVRVDGRSVPTTPRPEGTWGVPLQELPKLPGKLSIEVAHEGVREVLDGQLPGGAAAAPGPSAQSRGIVSTLLHKQMSWWILNVVIVLVGVVAVSRRMS